MPECPVPGCQKEFLGDNYAVELSRHLRMVHIGYKLPDSTVSSLSLLPCSLCGLYFSHSRGLTRHFSENHPNSQLPPVFSQFAPPAVTPSSAADQPLSILLDHPRCTFVLLSADEIGFACIGTDPIAKDKMSKVLMARKSKREK